MIQEITAAGVYRDIGQAFVVLLPVKSVGVMGDCRTYEQVGWHYDLISYEGNRLDTSDFMPDMQILSIAQSIGTLCTICSSFNSQYNSTFFYFFWRMFSLSTSVSFSSFLSLTFCLPLSVSLTLSLSPSVYLCLFLSLSLCLPISFSLHIYLYIFMLHFRLVLYAVWLPVISWQLIGTTWITSF